MPVCDFMTGNVAKGHFVWKILAACELDRAASAPTPHLQVPGCTGYPVSLRSVHIGNNQQRMGRACSLGLALAAVHELPPGKLMSRVNQRPNVACAFSSQFSEEAFGGCRFLKTQFEDEGAAYVQHGYYNTVRDEFRYREGLAFDVVEVLMDA